MNPLSKACWAHVPLKVPLSIAIWTPSNCVVTCKIKKISSLKMLCKNCKTFFSRGYTHPFNGPFPGLPRWAGTRKVKPIWILLKQETVSGSGISRAVCKFAPRSRQITTPAPHYSVFLQAGCPSCRPTNSVKALKVEALKPWLHVK